MTCGMMIVVTVKVFLGKEMDETSTVLIDLSRK